MGPVVFGGVAWAQNRGVRAVEVRIGDGGWQPAELGASYSNQTWRLWSFPWQAKSPGKQTITVRATDNTGAVQTADQVGTRPRRRHRLAHGELHRGPGLKHYFDEIFRQLNTAITMPITTVIGPMMDQVVVLLIGLPRSTPNPCSAQIRPNKARSTPSANVTTKVLFI